MHPERVAREVFLCVWCCADGSTNFEIGALDVWRSRIRRPVRLLPAKAEGEQQSTGRLHMSSDRLLIESFVDSADSKNSSGWMEYDENMGGKREVLAPFLHVNCHSTRQAHWYSIRLSHGPESSKRRLPKWVAAGPGRRSRRDPGRWSLPEHLPRLEQRAQVQAQGKSPVLEMTLLMHPAKIEPRTQEPPTNHDAGAVLNYSITSIAARPFAPAFPFGQGR